MGSGHDAPARGVMDRKLGNRPGGAVFEDAVGALVAARDVEILAKPIGAGSVDQFLVEFLVDNALHRTPGGVKFDAIKLIFQRRTGNCRWAGRSIRNVL